MRKRGKPLWSSWSEQFEAGCSLNPATAEEAEEWLAEAETAKEEQQRELLCTADAEPELEDQFVRAWDFWRKVLRHVDVIPNERAKKAVRLWLLRDFDMAPVFRNGFPVGETLRGTGQWLVAEGECVREKNGEPRERPAGYLPGQLFPQAVQELLEQGLGFCLATEFWLTDRHGVRSVGWNRLLAKCEQWVRDELRVKNRYTKATR